MTKYSTIMIDAPWHYPSPGWLGGADRHYETLPLDALLKMPMYKFNSKEFLEPDAHIWLWTTDTHMTDAITLFEFWGIQKRATFPWVKLSTKDLSDAEVKKALDKGETLVSWQGKLRRRVCGNGYYGRGVAEYLILGTQGKKNITIEGGRHTRRIIEAPGHDEFMEGTEFYAPAGVHSEKPDLAYEIAAAMSPGPRLDIFARKPHEGWDSWGREAENPVVIPDLDSWSKYVEANYQTKKDDNRSDPDRSE